MTEAISLHAFCKDNGNLPKTSVRRWLNENGHSTSNGLSPAAVEAALAQFCPAPAPAPAAGGLSIHTGNHCKTLDTPAFDGLTIDLGQFRESAALVIDDPLAVADKFLQTADLIQGALAEDIAAREQRLARTKQAQAQVAAKANQLKLEQRLYKLQTAQIDTATTEETTALTRALAELQSLGKPTEA